MQELKRSDKNPILKPNRKQSWEAEAVFNGCPIKKDEKIYLLYRAISMPHYHADARMQISISDIGIAESSDGTSFKKRRRFIVPGNSFDRYGCEDPRITKLNGKYYVFYTALSTYPFSPDGIKVGIAISKDLKKIDSKHLITPFNAKAMALFPGRVKGKMCAILTAHTDIPPSKIAIACFNKESDMWNEGFWDKWHGKIDNFAVPLQRRVEDHVEVGAPPIKTKFGWLLFYSYIRNYHASNKLFSIEAALLDLDNPTKVTAHTDGPLLSPDEEYELYGQVPNIVFPSGALLEGKKLSVYYGAADTTCCVATAELNSLITSMRFSKKSKITLTRSATNPILVPIKRNAWESRAVFNPAAVYEDGKVHIVYRAMSEGNTSVMGYATSKDGINIDYRHSEPIYVPREPFEKKLNPGGNSGCEDGRITKIGNRFYMCYTAYDGKHPPRVAFTSIEVKKFLRMDWDWAKPVLLSPPDFDNKDVCVFPEKVKGKYMFFHRIGDDIDISLVKDLDFDGKTFLEERRWLKQRPGMWDSKKVGIAATPFKTKKGWVLTYHGVSEDDHKYRVGAVLLDLKDPTRIIARTALPIFEPEMDYETSGQIPNVVFPCGNVVIGKKLFVYYGGGDSVVGVATIEVEKLLETLI